MDPHSNLLESEFDEDGFRQIHVLNEAERLRQENQRLHQRIRELTQGNGNRVTEQSQNGNYLLPFYPGAAGVTGEPPACPHFVFYGLSGKKLFFELAHWRSKTLRDFVEEICSKTGFREHQVMLIFQGRRMNEMDRTLAEYGIEADSRVDMTLSANWVGPTENDGN